MSCFPLRCKVSYCDSESDGYPQCPPALFSLVKIYQPLSDITIGDTVVLRPHHNKQLIISCGKAACRSYDYCSDPISKKCRRHYLKILSQTKGEGERLEHGDKIHLKFINLKDSYLKCDKENNLCKRLPLCGGDQCTESNEFIFSIFKLLI